MKITKEKLKEIHRYVEDNLEEFRRRKYNKFDFPILNGENADRLEVIL